MAGEESMSNGARAKCRTCLMKATSSAPSLFDHWRNGTSTIALDLARLTGVVILDSDPHSKIMCHTCCSKLHNACKFVDMVQESERHLRALEKSWPKPIQLDKNVSDVVYGNEDVQVKEEVLSEEDPFDTNDADEFNPEMDIKIEPEELVQPPPIEITVNGIFENSANSEPEATEEYLDEEYLNMPMKEEPISEDELSASDLPMDCLLCTKSFRSRSGLKAHVMVQHNYKTVRRKLNDSASPKKKHVNRFSCTACLRKFVTLTDLMVHETCHDKFICYACGRKCNSYNILIKHRTWCKKFIRSQKPTELELELPKPALQPARPIISPPQTNPPVTLKCLTCQEEFTDLYYLKVHKETHKTLNIKNEQLTDERLSNSDHDTSECNQIIQSKENSREMEIKLEITNIVTLQDQVDTDGNYEHPSDVKEQFKSDPITNSLKIEENSDNDWTIKNNEKRLAQSDILDHPSGNGPNTIKEALDLDENVKVKQEQNNDDTAVVNNIEDSDMSERNFCLDNV